MSYVLDNLYEAIANSKKEIGRFVVSDEREHGAGSVSFLATTGCIRQVYASPHWEIEDFQAVISGPVESEIACQLEEFNAESGEYIGTKSIFDLPFQLTGNLEVDLKSYMDKLESYLPTLP